jgi:nucleoside-diphosphate-sugar epimerase
MTSFDWNGRRVLVTGGTSFIGSHLVHALTSRGARVRVVDDLSSGRLANIQAEIDAYGVEFTKGDLRRTEVATRAVRDQEVVFHLAADHGGRGYVELHQSACAANLGLDANVFLACREAGIERVVYASSGCVYPNFKQTDPSEILYLSEDMVGPPYDADNMYGWAKLMAELTLKANCEKRLLRGASCRYFTVYGERGKEDHAVIAMIARAFVGQNPFEVWGTGEQIRNWTHVDDIVSGTLRAAEVIEDGTAVNIGTTERTRVIDAAKEVLSYTGSDADIRLLPDMPTGPLNRVADNSLAKQLLGWEPEVKFMDGLHRTIDWYFSTRDRDEVRADLARRLTER